MLVVSEMQILEDALKIATRLAHEVGTDNEQTIILKAREWLDDQPILPEEYKPHADAHMVAWANARRAASDAANGGVPTWFLNDIAQYGAD